jgi:hypothetical protein
MILKAELVGYSSIVGSSIVLKPEGEGPPYMLMPIGTTQGITPEVSRAIAAELERIINAAGGLKID